MVTVVDDRSDVMGDVMGWQIDEAYCGDCLYGDGLTIWLLVWWRIDDVIACMVTDCVYFMHWRVIAVGLLGDRWGDGLEWVGLIVCNFVLISDIVVESGPRSEEEGIESLYVELLSHLRDKKMPRQLVGVNPRFQPGCFARMVSSWSLLDIQSLSLLYWDFCPNLCSSPCNMQHTFQLPRSAR